MAKKNGAQSIEVIPGRKIVLSAGVGKTNIDELKWLTANVLDAAKAWKSSGLAYIADCSQMSPVSPSEGSELVNMTKAFVEAGCKAFAFAEKKAWGPPISCKSEELPSVRAPEEQEEGLLPAARFPVLPVENRSWTVRFRH